MSMRDIDLDKCARCDIPINYCDGMTRYKCGKDEADVEKYCRFQENK